MLPKPEPALAILLTYFSVLRAEHGEKFCRKHVIGPLRTRFELFIGSGGNVEVLAKHPTAGDFVAAAEEARNVLAFHCSMCPEADCRLKLAATED